MTTCIRQLLVAIRNLPSGSSAWCPSVGHFFEGCDSKHSTSFNAFTPTVFRFSFSSAAKESAFPPATQRTISSENPYKSSMFTHPATLLRIEESALLLATLFTYQHLHYSWLLFALL